MTLPDFIIIGAAKGGSTAFSAMLARHEDIFVVPHEVHFFSRDEHYKRGVTWYEDLFDDPAAHDRLRGENSNSYTMHALHPRVIDRMTEHLDLASLRVIYLVRNPLDRIESFWIEKRSHGGDDVHHDFNRAVMENTDWLIDPSRYWAQLSRYRSVLHDAQIHILFSEDLKNEPAPELDHCYRFLGLDPARGRPGPSVRANPSEGKLVQRRALSRLRRLPGYASVRQLVPAESRRQLRQRLFFTPLAERPQWDPDVRRWAVSQLADDAARLLEHCGKPADFWDL